jgi:hypothetical protein
VSSPATAEDLAARNPELWAVVVSPWVCVQERGLRVQLKRSHFPDNFRHKRRLADAKCPGDLLAIAIEGIQHCANFVGFHFPAALLERFRARRRFVCLEVPAQSTSAVQALPASPASRPVPPQSAQSRSAIRARSQATGTQPATANRRFKHADCAASTETSASRLR